jgi:hypothetical protein
VLAKKMEILKDVPAVRSVVECDDANDFAAARRVHCGQAPEAHTLAADEDDAWS